MNQNQIIDAIKAGTLKDEVSKGLTGEHFPDAAYLKTIMTILESMKLRGIIASFHTVSFSGATIPADWTEIKLLD
jgi:hypothetical protein